MTDFLAFLPVTTVTIDDIRARLDADLNAGLTPTDPGYLDLTEGGFAWDLTQAPAVEMERLWDFMATEVVAAMFVSFAWGEYLDMHGDVLDVQRKDAVAATGEVTFSGADGTFVPLGTQVAQPAANADSDPIAFETTASGTIASGTATLAVAAVDPGSSGNVAASTVTAMLSEIEGVTVTNASPISGGEDVESDDAYRDRLLLEYSATPGGGTTADYRRWALSYPGVGYVTVEPNTTATGSTVSGYVRVTVTDSTNSPVSEAVVDGLQDFLDPPSHTALTTGSVSMTGTYTINVDSTTGFGSTGNLQWKGSTTIAYTGKTSTTFTGCTGGSGTLPSGARLSQGFDQAEGQAPIGHVVTVQTVATQTVTVSATITPEAGYTLTGTGGTVAISDAIKTAMMDYINSLAPGEDVVLERVSAQVFRVSGVYDVSAVNLNGGASNVSVPVTAVARTAAGNITLS